MKKIYLILSVFAIVFTACETDFPINAPWEEVAVVYGLLDQDQPQQYIKINKAYLGEGDALAMASISDSVNFVSENMEVKLHRLNKASFNSWDTVQSVTLHDTIIEKEDGLFSTENNIIYTISTSSIPGFFNASARYALTIKNKVTDNFVSSNTEIINKFSFSNFSNSYKIGFYNDALPDSLKFVSKKISWEESTNGTIYQMELRFNYLEDGVPKSLIWTQPLVGYEGREMSSTLDGLKFFNFLKANIEEDALVRQFIDVDLIMTVGAKDLETYISVNKPITGIVQERPQYSNITNGIGLFSARYIYEEKGILLSNGTKDYLVDELGRNFIN